MDWFQLQLLDGDLIETDDYEVAAVRIAHIIMKVHEVKGCEIIIKGKIPKLIKIKRGDILTTGEGKLFTECTQH